jgi:hypothetical protein
MIELYTRLHRSPATQFQQTVIDGGDIILSENNLKTLNALLVQVCELNFV